MDLNATKLFVDTVQAGSLTAAAERLNMSLATLSRKIRELEQQLNTQLLECTPHGVILTEAGGRLYEYAKEGVETLLDAERAMQSDSVRLKGTLRLSLPYTFEGVWAVLQAFQAAYPDVKLEIYCTERRVDLAADGIDVALRIGELAEENMVAKRLFTLKHILVASPSFIARYGTPAQPQDLPDFPCVGWLSSTGKTLHWRIAGTQYRLNALLTSNDYTHLRYMALQGCAISELPEMLAAPYLASGELVRILPDYTLAELPVSLFYPHHRHPAPIVRAYVDFCVKYCQQVH